MDMTTFFSNSITALAWPIACLVIVLLFKKEIAAKIRAARSAEVAGTKIAFTEVADRVIARLPISEELLRDLTAREKQVAVLLLGGMTNTQIAEILSLSAKTVEVYRAMIFSVTGANTLDELRAALT
jgi:DNA-binding CsgD family transcriptional regulator